MELFIEMTTIMGVAERVGSLVGHFSGIPVD